MSCNRKLILIIIIIIILILFYTTPDITKNIESLYIDEQCSIMFYDEFKTDEKKGTRLYNVIIDDQMVVAKFIETSNYTTIKDVICEFSIGYAVSQKIPRCIAPHILQIYDLSICLDKKQYIFMERAEGDIKSLNRKDVDMGKIIFQLLFTLEGLQRSMMFMHNDLHAENVFYIKSENVNINMEPIYGKHLSYVLDDYTFFIQDDGIFPLIADFGLSQIFYPPMPIINNKVKIINNDYNDNRHIPDYNTFFDMYKLLISLSSFSEEIESILRYIYKNGLAGYDENADIFNQTYNDELLDATEPKISIVNMFQNISPALILKECPVFSKYKQPPKTEHIVDIGEII